MRNLASHAETWVKILVYGKSGTGKTSLGVTAPKPLILLSEKQGVLSVRQAAQRLGRPVPPTLLIDSLEDLRAVRRAFAGIPGEPFRVLAADGSVVLELPDYPETVVIDSLTDAGRLISEEIRRVAKPAPGKDGLPVDSARYWGVLSDRFQQMVLSFRDCPAHVLFLCLADDREAGEGAQKTRSVNPSLPMRKFPDMVAAATNAVGYSYRHQDAKGVSFGVLFNGPEHLLLKGCSPLRATEPARFDLWVRAITSSLEVAERSPPASIEVAAEAEAELESEKKGAEDGEV